MTTATGKTMEVAPRQPDHLRLDVINLLPGDATMTTPFPKEFASRLNSPIRTQRLMLEPLVAAHADILFDSLCDERLYRWIESGGPKDVAQLRSNWQRKEARLSPDGNRAWLNWAIRLETEGLYIGTLDAELDSPIRAPNVGFVALRPNISLPSAAITPPV